jgi:hypothetical protein
LSWGPEAAGRLERHVRCRRTLHHDPAREQRESPVVREVEDIRPGLAARPDSEANPQDSVQVIRTIWPVVLAALTARGSGNMHIVRRRGTTLHPRPTLKEYHSFPGYRGKNCNGRCLTPTIR